jgi:hypothetical protein
MEEAHQHRDDELRFPGFDVGPVSAPQAFAQGTRDGPADHCALWARLAAW